MIRARRTDIDGRAYWTAGPAAKPPASVELSHLLPIYDEYIVSYRDRAAVPHGPSMIPSGTGGGYVTFQHALIVAGRIAGTWRMSRSARDIAIAVTCLRRPSPAERRAIADAVNRYGRFANLPVKVTIA